MCLDIVRGKGDEDVESIKTPLGVRARQSMLVEVLKELINGVFVGVVAIFFAPVIGETNKVLEGDADAVLFALLDGIVVAGEVRGDVGDDIGSGDHGRSFLSLAC